MSLMLADIGVADALLPYRSQRWDNAGQEQHYLDEGSGDPVVMVHGNPSWCFLWRNAVAALRSDYRCIVPDHIGCGLSSRPTDAEYEFTFERRVADFGRLMDHLAFDRPVTIMAHDWGGMISMAWAVQNPGRVGRICLFNTGAFPNPHIKRLPASSPVSTAVRITCSVVITSAMLSVSMAFLPSTISRVRAP